jgi:hypothetical protein
MKFLLYLMFVCSAVAQDLRSQDYAPRYFPNKEAAITSAERAFAGGSYQDLAVGKKKVLVLFHYASGAFSSDAAIYVEEKASWHLVAYYAPLLNDSIEASAKDYTVVLKASHTKQVLLTVAIAPESKQEPNQKPEPTR